MTAPTVDPTLLDDARLMADDLTALRHALHQTPEIGLDLPTTQQQVLDAIADLGLEVSTGTALSSVVAVLRGAAPGPAVLLRGDMDGLPVTETSGEPFTSTTPGAMHACGHDLHMTGLVGALRLLAARRDQLAGSVVAMFQPGEEGPHGARVMIEEGVLDAAGERVVAAYGLHVMSAQYPVGRCVGRAGTLMAAADELLVTINGRGGHGSLPSLAADPVPVAAEIVLALQAAVTRQFDALDPVVLSVGKIAAGTVNNVIPATARLEATVRSFSEATHDRVEAVFTRVCEHVAAAHGLSATVEYVRGYPTTVNDPQEITRVADVATSLLGPDGYRTLAQPVAGAEDFSYVLQQVPGAFFFLGATPTGADPATAPYNHAPDARFDDAALPVAAAVLAGLAMHRLAAG